MIIPNTVKEFLIKEYDIMPGYEIDFLRKFYMNGYTGDEYDFMLEAEIKKLYQHLRKKKIESIKTK